MRCCIFFTQISCFLSFLLIIVSSELFTALVDFQNLLHTEGKIVKALENYLEIEEQRLEKVRRLCKEYGKLYQFASKDVETFLSNPINVYLLIKHLTADWKAAEVLIDGQASKAIVQNITHQNNLKFPGDEDLNGAAVALMRLQDTYLLDTATLARGLIEGTEPSPELTSDDCFELGRQAYNMQDYYHTVLWMQEALDRVEKENVKSADKAAILEYMAYSKYMLGNLRHALKLTKDLLNVDPGHPRGYGNLKYYSDVLEKNDQPSKRESGNMTCELQSVLGNNIPERHIAPETEAYERLCRGGSAKTPAEEKELKCRHITKNHPFLILQPAKEEELHLRPRIVIYHDVISDTEIEIIKYLSKPMLARAAGIHAKSGNREIGSYRISKSAWLKDEDHEVLRRISQRVKSITGLETDTAEALQVVNYGIGGHYEPHYDFAVKEAIRNFESLGTGNRIATWINYMSDVNAGGATVFPSIGVHVKPIKGSAAFWYNLLRNGDGDFNTLHAACPVLAGSKWVSNKWFHEYGQELRRPCSLNAEE